MFPSSLKIAKVSLLRKGGCTYNATNYRPISVLSPPKYLKKLFISISLYL